MWIQTPPRHTLAVLSGVPLGCAPEPLNKIYLAVGLRVKDDKVVGGFYLLLQFTLLFPDVLLLREHPASAAASDAVRFRIAATGVGIAGRSLRRFLGQSSLNLRPAGRQPISIHRPRSLRRATTPLALPRSEKFGWLSENKRVG